MVNMDYLVKLIERLAPSEPTTGTIGSIDLNIWLPQIMGVPLVGLKSESKSLKTMLVVYGSAVSTVLLFYVGFEIYDLFISFGDFEALVHNICMTLMHLSVWMKSFNLIYYRCEMRGLIEKLKLVVKTFVVSKKQQSVFFRGEFENKLLMVIYGLTICNAIILSIIMLLKDPENVAGKKFPFHVVLPSWIPLPLKKVCMSLGVAMHGLQIIGVDYFNINFMNQIRFQLQILNIAFEDLMIFSIRDEDREEMSKHERLKLIIKHHCLLIELRNDIEKIFSFAAIIQFFTSIIVYALAGFMITTSGAYIFIYFYLICTLMQLFLYCWFGNEVFEQSQTLATSGYNCNWYQFDQRFKSSLLIFLGAAQRPLYFSAGGLITLSLPTFTGIISKSYTYMAVLQQLYGENLPPESLDGVDD